MGINKLFLVFGSTINGAFLRTNTVAELSLVTVPIAADKNDKQLLMETDMCEFRFKSVKSM